MLRATRRKLRNLPPMPPPTPPPTQSPMLSRLSQILPPKLLKMLLQILPQKQSLMPPPIQPPMLPQKLSPMLLQQFSNAVDDVTILLPLPTPPEKTFVPPLPVVTEFQFTPTSNLEEVKSKFCLEQLQKVMREFVRRYGENSEYFQDGDIELGKRRVIFKKEGDKWSFEIKERMYDCLSAKEKIIKYCKIELAEDGEITSQNLEMSVKAPLGYKINLYNLVCNTLSAPNLAPNLPEDAVNVVTKALGVTEDYSEERLQNMWRNNSPLPMTLLSGVPKTDIVVSNSEDAIILNNALYHSGKLDMHSGGEKSVESFRKFVENEIRQNETRTKKTRITPQSCSRTSIPFQGRSATVVTKDIGADLFHDMVHITDFIGSSKMFGANEAPHGVGVIIDPNCPGVFFPYVSQFDQYTMYEERSVEDNMRIFQISATRDNRAFSKGIEQMLHIVRSENLENSYPIAKDEDKFLVASNYGKERSFYWNEAWGNYTPESVIGIVTLDMSSAAVKSAINLSDSYYPTRPIVRYSYLRNELVPIKREYLQKLAESRYDAVRDKFSEIFSSVAPFDEIEFTKPYRHSNDYLITLESTSESLILFLEMTEKFMERTIYQKDGNKFTISLSNKDLTVMEDLFYEFAHSEQSVLKLSNELFEMIFCENKSYDEYERKPLDEKLRKTINNRSGSIHRCIVGAIRNGVVNVDQIGNRAQIIDSFQVHPEVICFTFSHPSNPNIECVTFMHEGENYCLFFDRSTEEMKFIGAAFHPFMQEKRGEWSVGFPNYIASHVTGETSQQYEKLNLLFDKRIRVGAEIYLNSDSIVIEFTKTTAGVFAKRSLPTKSLQDFIGEDFVVECDSNKPILNLRFCYNERGEIEITFNQREHRDNFIRAFNGDVPTQGSHETPFAIDPTDDSGTKLIVRKNIVDIMESTDPNHGHKKSLNLLLDLSDLNKGRAINFAAMQRESGIVIREKSSLKSSPQTTPECRLGS